MKVFDFEEGWSDKLSDSNLDYNVQCVIIKTVNDLCKFWKETKPVILENKFIDYIHGSELLRLKVTDTKDSEVLFGLVFSLGGVNIALEIEGEHITVFRYEIETGKFKSIQVFPVKDFIEFIECKKEAPDFDKEDSILELASGLTQGCILIYLSDIDNLIGYKTNIVSLIKNVKTIDGITDVSLLTTNLDRTNLRQHNFNFRQSETFSLALNTVILTGDDAEYFILPYTKESTQQTQFLKELSESSDIIKLSTTLYKQLTN